MKPIESMSLSEILSTKVDQDRIERLKKLTRPDVPEDTPEIVIEYLLANQARVVDIQYKRFLAGTKINLKEVDDLCQGSIDIHAHGGSEPFERLLDDDDLAIACMKRGMRAIVIKTWFTPSASRNALVNNAVHKYAEEHGMEPIQVFGGITLNQSVGGINPDAVKRCLKFPGMKYVWLPMVDSYHHRRVVFDDQTGSGIHIVDKRGHVLPEVMEVIKICADNNLTLASGHYPANETAEVLVAAKNAGVKHREIVHPAHIHSKHSIKQMKEAAAEGHKLMLSGLGTLVFPLHESGALYAAHMISEVGAENFVYGSDFGQIQNPSHVEALSWMIKTLMAYGVTAAEIKKMFKDNPAEHLELPVL